MWRQPAPSRRRASDRAGLTSATGSDRPRSGRWPEAQECIAPAQATNCPLSIITSTPSLNTGAGPGVPDALARICRFAMKILFLTQVLPFPLDAGPKVRAYYTLAHLANAGHAVTLLSFVRASDTVAAVDHLNTICERIVTVPLQRSRLRDLVAVGRSLISGEPLLIARDRNLAMLQRVRQLAARADYAAVHADQLWMAPYALAARRAAAGPVPGPRLILDQHNAVYLVPQRMADTARHPWARLALRRESRRMAAYEAWACRAFDRVVTVTDEDRRCLLALYRNGHPARLADVIPICLDPQAISPLRQPLNSAELLFIGGMHWPPNADAVRWFVSDILPGIRARVATARFTAVGRQPPAELQSLTASAQLHLPGYVDDVQPFWHRSSAFVVPLRAGGGMRVKILEAWARGRPVISTTIGAEGLSAAHGQNILLADTPAEFAEAVARVLVDPALAERLACGGRATIERDYDWRTTYRAWDQVYAGIDL
jgi:polysaccharide biosynthesis protein PslH